MKEFLKARAYEALLALIISALILILNGKTDLEGMIAVLLAAYIVSVFIVAVARRFLPSSIRKAAINAKGMSFIIPIAIFLGYLPVMGGISYAVFGITPLLPKWLATLLFPLTAILIMSVITLAACVGSELQLIGGLAAVVAIYCSLLLIIRKALRKTGFFRKHTILLYVLLFITASIIISALMLAYSAAAFSLLRCYWD